MSDTNTLRPFAFVLAVQDLDRNTAYFRDVLGFRVDWADATDWRIVARGDVRIMLGHCPDALPPVATGDHSYFGYLEVDDVNALHDEFARKGAIVLQPPVDRPYGMRECTVATPDGHRFVVGQSIA
ncbi:VOC family protein [Paraburkholderia flagellata]|uniref:VOC family protein n=1 Tax=Paraburkholderia flagellata TaxID=2883241 RepID=UPI001F350EB7|nr:VOC family protein [Paraburkholderia flagellata]